MRDQVLGSFDSFSSLHPKKQNKTKVPFLLKANVNGIMGRDNLHLKDSWPILLDFLRQVFETSLEMPNKDRQIF